MLHKGELFRSTLFQSKYLFVSVRNEEGLVICCGEFRLALVSARHHVVEDK